ncbi:MAG: sodium:proton exchanger [Flavobacteriales bacterium]|jgi:NhaP-type Na+/H+ or K+/H+ antiporter|nr:sodium:proton exchanger [Flavobacteriales bacterium]NCG30240.1 sodium:proton exchanger [Bacteroidota bacterium]MBT3963862.1 sodium:proton exchanger [Flavobacteriales bacterium]MBT4706230.1 sodium:proton exchanger [Flavobacteriales bacterium]MBT4929520.1 sodium:proton exchanger [Flavobacteriales bacterium]
MSAYSLVIAASAIVILSYFYNLIAKKTNIPSVLLLIATGIVVKQAMNYFEVVRIDWFPYLELLGIVGLIMIVLEAALDLKLERKKMPLIGKSLLVSLLGLITSSFAAAFIIHLILPDFTWIQSMIYAVPLSILSSAIIIPSVIYLPEKKKEFMIYESTFSDILGIMMFYFLISLAEPGSNQEAVGNFVWSFLLTIVISAVVSYGLIYIFQNIKTQVKTFLLIAILILLYAIGKQFHLSSLIIILVFGLVISNSNLFFPGFLKRTLKVESVQSLFHELHIVTGETAFIVRTFFFVIFGITIVLSSLLSVKVILVSALILASIYGLRFVMFQIFLGRDIMPEVYIAPRGLITVLLFFAIPSHLQVASFDNGILLFVIIATGIIMTWAMIRSSDKDVEDEVLDMLEDDKNDALAKNDELPLNE